MTLSGLKCGNQRGGEALLIAAVLACVTGFLVLGDFSAPARLYSNTGDPHPDVTCLRLLWVEKFR